MWGSFKAMKQSCSLIGRHKIETTHHLLYYDVSSQGFILRYCKMHPNSTGTISITLLCILWKATEEIWGGEIQALIFWLLFIPSFFLCFSSKRTTDKSFFQTVSIQVKVQPDGCLSARISPSASSNCRTVTRSICRGRVKHLQIRNHFYVKRKSRRLTQNTGNVWSRRWSEPCFLSNHRLCGVYSAICAHAPETLGKIEDVNSLVTSSTTSTAHRCLFLLSRSDEEENSNDSFKPHLTHDVVTPAAQRQKNRVFVQL